MEKISEKPIGYTLLQKDNRGRLYGGGRMCPLHQVGEFYTKSQAHKVWEKEEFGPKDKWRVVAIHFAVKEL